MLVDYLIVARLDSDGFSVVQKAFGNERAHPQQIVAVVVPRYADLRVSFSRANCSAPKIWGKCPLTPSHEASSAGTEAKTVDARSRKARLSTRVEFFSILWITGPRRTACTVLWRHMPRILQRRKTQRIQFLTVFLPLARQCSSVRVAQARQ